MRARALRISDRVGAASAVFDRHGHAEEVVLTAQRNHLIVEAVFDVTQFLDGPDFLTERFDIREQLVRFRRSHDLASFAWKR